ncbi:casein kinase II regulatory subunit [Nitzschia inconspicua]|uniref:Casein kinase II subunit beta n=1 Tax=Nitzschia inconspicua TaxID=303405 RepID=A0A9K3LLM0_9STRA|nr:casein kinase II regulatory subunit [Nitzschia inconspicua]KAG7364089.1 casein kinase II regulatory subunit [Nitzschia inconspicua]
MKVLFCMATSVLLVQFALVDGSSSSSFLSVRHFGDGRRPPLYRKQIQNRKRRSKGGGGERQQQLDYDDDDDDDDGSSISYEGSTASSTPSNQDDIWGLGDDDGDDFEDIVLLDNNEDDDEMERILLALEESEKRKQPKRPRRVTLENNPKPLSSKRHSARKKKRRSTQKPVDRNTKANTKSLSTPTKITKKESNSIGNDAREEDHRTLQSLRASQSTSAVAPSSSFVIPKFKPVSRNAPQQSRVPPLQPVRAIQTTVIEASSNKVAIRTEQPAPTSQTEPQHPETPSRISATTSIQTRMPSVVNRPKQSVIPKDSTPWIQAFLKQRHQDMLLPVPKDYISDNFNLAQLPPIIERIGFQAMGDKAASVAKALQQHRQTVANAAAVEQVDGSNTSRSPTSFPIYRLALRLILMEEGELHGQEEDHSLADEERILPPEAIQTAAEALYLLVHARFAISPRGLEALRHVMMIDRTVFGKCPRPMCRGCGTLPYGYSVDYRSSNNGKGLAGNSASGNKNFCHRYCPSCGEVWISWNSRTDGCAWGPSWCHLFLLTFGTQVYAEELDYIATKIGRSVDSTGIRSTTTTNLMSNSPPPSVFGFRVHPATPFGTPFNEQVRGTMAVKYQPIHEN